MTLGGARSLVCDLGRGRIFGAAWCLLGGMGLAWIFTVYPGGGGGRGVGVGGSAHTSCVGSGTSGAPNKTLFL